MKLKNYMYICGNITSCKLLFNNLPYLYFFNYLLLYTTSYFNYSITSSIDNMYIYNKALRSMDVINYYKINNWYFDVNSNNNSIFYSYFYANELKDSNIQKIIFNFKKCTKSYRRAKKLFNKVKFRYSYFFYKRLLSRSIKIANTNVSVNHITTSRQKYSYFYIKKKGKRRYFKKKKFYLNYFYIFKSKHILNNLFYIYTRIKKKRYVAYSTKTNLKWVRPIFEKKNTFKSKTFNIEWNKLGIKSGFSKKLSLIFLINSYLSLKKRIDKFSYYQKIFYFDSILLVSYFSMLTQDMCSLNYKYYRIRPSYGRRPYGFKLVNRKRFFFLKRRELHELYKLTILVFKTSDITLLKTWIKNVFESINFKKHKFLCYIIRFYFKRLFAVYKRYTTCKGLYFRVKGKISVSGNSRKRAFRVKLGLRSFSRKSLKIQYTDFYLLTGSGILGVKLLFSFQ